jgi:hypothetical protein
MLLAAGLCAISPAFASGGTASGGGSASGGGTTSGGSKTTASQGIYTTVALTSLAGYYAPAPGTGSATFGYAADNSWKSLDISLAGLSYADGTELQVEVYMTRPDPVAYYGTTTTVSSGTMSVIGGGASLSVNSANGDVVPDFPLPGTGTTTLYIIGPNGTYLFSGSLAQGQKQKRSGGA